MQKKRLKAKKISDKADYLKLFEATDRYVSDEVVRTSRKRIEIIRELAEEARIARVSVKQMSIGLLKPVRAAQKEIVQETLSETVAAPLDSLLDEIQKIGLGLEEANKQLAAAAAEAENQRKNLRRIFYIVSLVWNLLYNFARFSSRDLPQMTRAGEGVAVNDGEAANEVAMREQQLIEEWAVFDPLNSAQATLAREVNRRMTEQHHNQRKS